MAPESVARIVDAALGVEIRSCRRPREGSVADTFLLELEGERAPSRAVCKLGGASVWTGDVIEPLVIERVAAEAAIPVPDVLARGSLEGRPLDRWALYEHLEGTTPNDYAGLEPATRRRIVAEAGDLLGRLHATPAFAFDRIGGLARDGERLRLCEPDGWHAVDPGFPLERLPLPLAGDEGCRPVLAHGDYQPSNLLVGADGGVAAVLDWGNAHVTCAAYALARAEVRFVDLHRDLSADERRRLRRTFRDAYARRAPLESEYAARAPIYKCCWIAQSGANYARLARTPRGRTQLRRQVRRLGRRVGDPDGRLADGRR